MTALVMELVEGDDLSTLIARGPVSLSDTLPIAKQIADALEAAHEQSIIHRDLKPANIKVRADGTVKVLDFGLAKAMDPAGASSAPASALANSPTITSPAMTQMGMILGTAAYMSPEQAKGRAVDKRADIWAFGAVLYEMLTGQRAFKGEDISDTLASVLKDAPLLDVLPPDTPPRLTRLIARCLDRDLKTRLRDIGEARIEIARIEAGAPDSVATAAAATPAAPPSRRRVLPWAAAGVLGAGLAAALLAWVPWRATPASTPRKLLASIGADASLWSADGASAILSPDGTTLAFVAAPAKQARPALFIRKLDELQATALAGTEGALNPFFSPDGQWIAYFAGGQLKKVSITGGASKTLCEAPNGRGGTWTDDDTIIFTPEGTGPNTRLMRVPAAGGAPAVFGTLGPGVVTQRWPQALPDGRTVLYTEHASTSGFDAANLVVAPLTGGAPKIVLRGGFHGRYVSGGHLVYMNQGTLFAVRFDLDRLETVGTAVPAIEGIAANQAVNGGTQLAVSSEGTLVYVPGTAMGPAAPLDWLTRDGKTSPLRAAKADWGNPRFSPDGQRLAIDISDGKQRDIWVYEWARDTLTQLTFDAAEDRVPVWTPDSRRIVFGSDRAKAGVFNLYWVNSDGTGQVSRLTDSPNIQWKPSWHPSGKFLAFIETRAATQLDVMVLPMEGDATRGWTPGTPTVFLSTQANEVLPVFSPDGRFIAYSSTEAGSTWDIYVRPFPGPGGKWRVSTTGGVYPVWSATTHELLFANYLDPTPTKIMAAPYTIAGDSFQIETPKAWSPTSVQRTSTTNSGYDLHPDGKRIAAFAVVDQGTIVQDKVVFVFNFGAYLAKIAPGK
jgi:Tol biopolymer transport system component